MKAVDQRREKVLINFVIFSNLALYLIIYVSSMIWDDTSFLTGNNNASHSIHRSLIIKSFL